MTYSIKYNLDPFWLIDVDDDDLQRCTLNAMVLVNDDTFFREYRSDAVDTFHKQFDDWIEQSMPGRAEMICRGCHDFYFDDEELSDGSERLDYCRQVTYAFDRASDLALFKLKWGNAV